MNIVKQQLAYNLNNIISNYLNNNNIYRFYKKLNKLNICIYKNISEDLYIYFKNDFYIIYNNIINNNNDKTFINDFI